MDDIAAALADGQLVCIFPEGGLTKDGDVAEFRPGVLKVLERSPVPVIPMALMGLWRSVFSRNRAVSVPFAKLFPTVRLAIGTAREPAGVTPDWLRLAVTDLMAGRN